MKRKLDNTYNVSQRIKAGERRAKRLVITVNGPLAWGRSCPFCSFCIVHRKQRGGGNQWGNVARANASVIAHMKEQHRDKID